MAVVAVNGIPTIETVNGTAYPLGTVPKVVKALEDARLTGTRIRIFYGDNVDGLWHEEYQVSGKVIRSTGITKVPLLMCSDASVGGASITAKKIVKIICREGGKGGEMKTLYEKPGFIFHKYTVNAQGERPSVSYANVEIAFFDTVEQANRYAAFMNGERMGR